MRTQIAVSLQNGSLPCLPGADGLADTGPAVNLTTGTRYHGANLLYLKDFQKRNGFPTAEYATLDAIKKSGVPIRAGEKGVDISFAEKNSQTGEWDNKTVKLFNVAQTARPWEFKAYAEKLTAEKEQEKQTFLKSQYGDAYQSREKAEQKPGPTITCSSTEPERYLGQYLAAVSLGGAFKATPQQSAEFAQKMKDQLYKPMAESEYPDPFKLSKICRDAGVQCKEIIKEIKQPQHEVKQQREQTHSRRM
jgi:superfamily II DNA/RNA helicase